MRWIPLILVMVVLYTNCSPSGVETEQSSFSLGDPRDVNNFKQPPPAVICGVNGYGFLLSNYIRYNCGSCHSEGGIAFPQFTHGTLNEAYWQAQLVPRDRWLATVSDNRFCGPACNLSPTGQMYQGLEEWLDHQTGCP